MINTWIKMNAPALVKLKKFLVECEYKPEYDNFPLRPIQSLFNGAEAEINRLQNELQVAKTELERLKKPAEKKRS